MSQPEMPASGGAPAGLQSQNGAASASGSPCTNGPVQNALMSSQVSGSQGYNFQLPGSYPHLIPAKTLNPASGQSNYGSSQGSGQTLNRPPVASNLVTPSLHSGLVSRMPLPASQNPAAASMPSGSFLPGTNLPPPLNWQYNYPSTESQTNHSPRASSQPPVSGSTSSTTNHQYVSSGDPSLQNSFLKSGSSVPPLANPPLPTTFQPGAPHGPPPAGAPPLVRGLMPQKTSYRAVPQPSFNSATNQDGITSNTNNGSMVVHSSYDEIEGGGFLVWRAQAGFIPASSGVCGWCLSCLSYRRLTDFHIFKLIFPESKGWPGNLDYTFTPLGANHLTASLSGLHLHPEGLRVVNLLQERNMLPSTPLQAPVPNLHEDIQKLNCNPELFRCTLTSIPQTQALLNKAKLPLGLLLHPFKDLVQLPVVTSSTIVRCRSCRTYINPFVSFLDQRRWKCNLCYRVNDAFKNFYLYALLSLVYYEPKRLQRIMAITTYFCFKYVFVLRPPQPPVYLFVFDVSHNAVETGYLNSVCQSLLENLDLLPGNTRTKIGFITFDSTIHFYSLQEGLSQPQMLIVSDIEDVFIPMPENLLVNLNESKEKLVQDLLKTLPQMFTKTLETQSALGPALQAAFKLMSPTGGRMSVFQTQLPSLGVGALKPREEPNQRSSAKEIHLTPSTDFYKKLALDCSGQQVAVDLFLLSGQYSDLASLGCISRYSAGSVYYYPSYHHQHNPVQVQKLQKELQRYLTRKIGFEAVMRIRCTKGLSIHTFHGNFFVRSTDLLSLPNVNPDAGYAVQMSVEESLTDTQLVSFQSALLYTSSKGERRIRVHTLCLPVVSTLNEIFLGADVQAISGLLANMAVDRSMTASLSDARDALVNAVIDSLSAYRSSVLSNQQPGLLVPFSLRLFPLFVLALLKQKSYVFNFDMSLNPHDFTESDIMTLPLKYILVAVWPGLALMFYLISQGALNINDRTIPQPPILQLSVEKLSRDGAFLMDAGSVLMLWVGKNCAHNFLSQVLGVQNYASIPQPMTDLPQLNTAESARTIAFISWLRDQRPFFPILYVIRDESPMKANFLQNMVEDRTESALSYYEFLLHIQQQVNK
uniref:SEC24 homolog A, COPII coat complex component n=1 Tax=Otolemur garnettii TaxID=30611 RepID=H0X8X9_OTOGA